MNTANRRITSLSLAVALALGAMLLWTPGTITASAAAEPDFTGAPVIDLSDAATYTSGGTGFDWDPAGNNTIGLITITGGPIRITGSAANTLGILVDGDVAILLDGVEIEVLDQNQYAFRVADNTSAELWLEGVNTLQSGRIRAGLEVAEGAAAEIYSDSGGSLKATGGSNSAGIGGGQYQSAGRIVIGGNAEITANGNQYGAGIGGGFKGTGGYITITGSARVVAKSSVEGAGIGGGSNGSGGTIIITGNASVQATGGNGRPVSSDTGGAGAGIGGGGGDAVAGGDSGTITIDTTGTVNAQGGNGTYDTNGGGSGGGAGIGGGGGDFEGGTGYAGGRAEHITIESNNVTAQGGAGGSGDMGNAGGAGAGVGHGGGGSDGGGSDGKTGATTWQTFGDFAVTSDTVDLADTGNIERTNGTTITIYAGGDYRFAMKPGSSAADQQIDVRTGAGKPVKLILDNITTNRLIYLDDNSTVDLHLEGDSHIDLPPGYASALETGDNVQATIRGTGSLVCENPGGNGIRLYGTSTLTIHDGAVTAKGGTDVTSGYGGAGIRVDTRATLTVVGGEVTAIGGPGAAGTNKSGGAGIGGYGDSNHLNGGSVSISGGVVRATGGAGGSGGGLPGYDVGAAGGGTHGGSLAMNGGELQLEQYGAGPLDNITFNLQSGDLYDASKTLIPITNVTPGHGDAAGGTQVVLTGQRFNGSTSGIVAITDIEVGGIPLGASGFTLDSDTQITLTTPAGTAGQVDIELIHPVIRELTAPFTYEGGGTVDPGPGPNPGGNGGGSSTRSSSGSGGSSTPDRRVAKTRLPDTAFSWDGDRTLTINHERITALGLLQVHWDGLPLTRGEQYSVYEGSVIVRFDEGFIVGQSPGDHTVRVEFLNHTGETTVTVGDTGPATETDDPPDNETYNPNTGGYSDGSYPGATDNPNTGDSGGIWLALLPAAALTMYGLAKLWRRLRRNQG